MPAPIYRDYIHVRSTPLLDLLSVCIQSNNDYDQGPLEVYGTIQLIDVENGSASYVYRRPSKKPEIILPGYNLPLVNSKGSYRSLFIPRAAAYKLRFNLKDANFHDKVIAKGDFDLQLLNDRDEIRTQVVPGRNGYHASVSYATLPHAVVATVKLTLTKIGVIGYNRRARIYGCISASSKLQQGNVISSVLLDKPLSDPLKVILGKPIKLARYVLAVPAYSSLEIKADLWDSDTFRRVATDVTLADCEAQDNDVEVPTCILRETFHVRAQVCWNNAYELLDDVVKPLDKQQILHDKGSNPTLSYGATEDELLASSPIPSFSGSPMVEVFSITVSPNCDTNSKIRAEIDVYDDDNFRRKRSPYCIFKSLVSLSKDMKIKSLKWPNSPFRGESFGMDLHIYDVKGSEFCRGHFFWDKLSTTSPISWYGKLISSVIRGKHGYATVHYAMFPSAVDARVYVKVIPDDSSLECMVVGNITAWYSSVTYSSYSQNKFFRSTLLGDVDYTMLSRSNSLRLQKKVVAVPLDSSLIVGIKFKVGGIGKTSENRWIAKYLGSFDEAVDFKINVGKVPSKIIVGEDCRVEVSVGWRS